MAAGLLLAVPAHAEPSYALYTGKSCGACHVNPNGGGLTTPEGADWLIAQASFETAGIASPVLADVVRIGAMVEATDRRAFAYSAELGPSTYSSEKEGTFGLSELRLMFGIAPEDSVVSFVFDEHLAPNAPYSPDAYLMVRDPGTGASLKAGAVRTAFGLGQRDDEAFVRGDMVLNTVDNPSVTVPPPVPELGVEAGISGERGFAAAAFTNRRPDLTLEDAIGPTVVDPTEDIAFDPVRRRLSGTGTLVLGPVLVGASAAWTRTVDPDFPSRDLLAGVHGGVGFWRVAARGEIVWRRADDRAAPLRSRSGRTYRQLAALAAVDVQTLRGLFLRAGAESFDPALAVDENQRARYRFGADWTPVQRVILRAEMRVNLDIPQRSDQNRDELRVSIRGVL